MADNNVEVKFGAETSGLTAGTEQAQSATETATTGMSNAFRAMSESVSGSMAAFKSSVTLGIHETTEQVEAFNHKIAGIGKIFSVIGEAVMIGFIGERILELGEKTATYAHEMELASMKTGMSTDALQGFAGVAKTSGANVDSFLMGMRKLSQAMVEAQQGGQKQATELEKVGISASELKGLKLEDAIYKIADSYKEHNDGAGKVANAQALMGRGGMALIPMFDKGSEAIKEMVEELRSMGAIMSTEDIEKAASLKHELELMELGMDALKRQIGMALVPVLSTMAKSFIESEKHGGAVTQMATACGAALKMLASAAVFVITPFQFVGKTLAMVAAVIATMTHDTYEAGAVWRAYKEDISGVVTGNTELINSFWKVSEAKKASHGEGPAKKDMPIINKPESMVPYWKKELDDINNLQENWYKTNIDSDLSFWRKKLQNASMSEKDRLEVSRMTAALEKQEALKAVGDRLAELKTQESDTTASWQVRKEAAATAVQLMAATYKVGSKEYESAIQAQHKIDQEYNAERIKLAQDVIAHERELSLIGISIEQDRTKFLLQMGSITSAEAIEQERQSQDRIYKIKHDAAVEAANMPGLKNEDYLKRNQEIETLERQHTQVMEQINQKAALDSSQKWHTMYDSITSSMTSAVKGLIAGTTTLHSAMVSLVNSIVNSFIDMGAKIIIDWGRTVLFQQTASATSEATRVSTAAAANATILGSGIATNVALAASNAAVYAGAAMASVACIPFVGWSIAPGVGMESYALGMTFAGMASASGGYDIPAGINPVTQLHAQEMVLPAHLANPLRNMLSSGGSSVGGSTVVINTMDAKGVRAFMTEHATTLVNVLNQKKRGFAGVK